MSLNPYKIKRTVSIIIIACLSSICTFAGLLYFGFLGGLGGMLISMVVGIPIGLRFSRNPYTPLCEGEGIGVLDLNSTGIIQPFSMQVNTPDITGVFRNKIIQAHFDRDIVSTIGDPVVCKESKVFTNKDGDVFICLKKEDYQRARFVMTGKPLLLFNSMTSTFFTRENVQNMENTTLSLHAILASITDQVSMILMYLKGFEKYTISLLGKNKDKMMWIWIILIILAGILLVTQGPKILQQLQNAMPKSG